MMIGRRRRHRTRDADQGRRERGRGEGSRASGRVRMKHVSIFRRRRNKLNVQVGRLVDQSREVISHSDGIDPSGERMELG